MKPGNTLSEAGLSQKALSPSELIVMVMVAAAGFGVAFLLGIDRYNTSLKRAQGILYLLEGSIGTWSCWALLRFGRLPKHVRLPAALWALVIWFGMGLSSIAYFGYVMMPVEVLLSGAAPHIRGGVDVARALGIACCARVMTFACVALCRPIVLAMSL